jgi:hypothetical protein
MNLIIDCFAAVVGVNQMNKPDFILKVSGLLKISG